MVFFYFVSLYLAQKKHLLVKTGAINLSIKRETRSSQITADSFARDTLRNVSLITFIIISITLKNVNNFF